MWLEAIITQEDFVHVLAEILPVKIYLDEARDRWLLLHRAGNATLVPDEGLRMDCVAELRWTLAGLTPTVQLEQLAVMLRPRITETDKGHVLEFNFEIAEADIRGLPALIDATIVKAVNAALSEKKLTWNFTETLTRTVGLGDTFEPLEALKIGAAWGKQRISAEALALVVSFRLGFVRGD